MEVKFQFAEAHLWEILSAIIEMGEELPEAFIVKWKNLNSFVARITSTDFAPWLVFPIWRLTMVLEEPPVAGSAMEWRAWVETDWIIRCVAVLFKEMNSIEQLDGSTACAFMTGPPCDTEEPLGMKRWNFLLTLATWQLMARLAMGYQML